MRQKTHFSSALLAVTLSTCFLLGACAPQASTSGNSVGVVSTVTMTDKVETSGNLSADKLTTLKWGTDGVIEKVNVQVGDKVKTDEVLASLRVDSVEDAELVTGKADLASAQRDLQDLLDSKTALAKAQLELVTAQENLETAQDSLEALSYQRASDTLIEQTQAKIWEAEKKLKQVNNAYKEVERRQDGDGAKTAALLKLTTAQLELNELRATYNWYTAQASQADYDEAQAGLEVARAALEDAQRQREIVKEGLDPLKLAAAEARVIAAQALVNTMYIIAPFDGEVISVQAGVGNAVASGDSAVELVDCETLKVETLVDEANISALAVGNPAEIRFDSLPEIVLTGKVGRIKRIGTTVNGLVKYTVVVLVDPTDQPVLYGATVNVTITTGEPHAMLAVPISAVSSNAQGEFVTLIKADGSTQQVAVESGNLVDNLVTITTTEGLKAGDQLQLGTASNAAPDNSDQGPGGGILPGGGGGGGPMPGG